MTPPMLGHDLPTVTINEGDGLIICTARCRVRWADRADDRTVTPSRGGAVCGSRWPRLTIAARRARTSQSADGQDADRDQPRGTENRAPADDLQIIERRLERTLQCFLDFARPPKMDRRTIDLTRVIDKTLSLLGGRVRKQGIQLDYEPKFPHLMIEADPEQLQQLFVNLTMNALDAMPTGGRLMIEVVHSQRGSQFVEVRVCDTGAGISAELLPRLFQPFVSGKETGLGLGLVVSQRIAEEHGGTLGAVNRLQGGACLTLRLPVSTNPSSPESEVTLPSPVVARNVVDVPTLLVIDGRSILHAFKQVLDSGCAGGLTA